MLQMKRMTMDVDDPFEKTIATSGLRTADIVDAMGRRHRHRCHLLDLVSPTPDKTLFGPAATIAFAPSCETRLPVETFNFSNAFAGAVGADARGKVLVLASNGHQNASLGGGVKLSRVHHRQLAGVLADGRLRDFSQLAAFDFVTFCKGETTLWGGGEVTPFEADSPVVFDRVLIFPGDFIFADSSGAVVIPAADVHEVLAMARAVVKEDADAVQKISRRGGSADSKSSPRDIGPVSGGM
jgi:4-hydroxy-4-methyl-2-oxoglutarate aldolase